MLNQELKNLNLPDPLRMNDGTYCDTTEKWEKRREEIIELFEKEVFGKTPKKPENVKYEIISTYEKAVAGFATYNRIKISFNTEKGEFSYEADLYLPNNVINVPLAIFLHFGDGPTCRVFPIEDLINANIAILAIRYEEIMVDKNDFSKGLAGMFLDDINNRKSHEWGAIGCWAYAVSCAVTVALTIDCIDSAKIALIGHSRLGKTSLWCAVQDTRISLAVINNSGNTGASLSRGNTGETIKENANRHPYWFEKDYAKYADNLDKMPFDQHFLVSAIAPRKIYICSRNRDHFASPKTEFLSAYASSKAYNLHNLDGLICDDNYPTANTFLDKGNIIYSICDGGHFLGRYEWDNIINILQNMD